MNSFRHVVLIRTPTVLPTTAVTAQHGVPSLALAYLGAMAGWKTVDEAVEGLRRIADDYPAHARRADEIARSVGRVLPSAKFTYKPDPVRQGILDSWPKSLDTLYGGCEYFAKRVAEITDNKFQVRTFAAGEIVPGLQVLDAVQNGTVECCHTCSYYYVGKDPAFAFGTNIPFGLNARQQNAWKYYGGGNEALAALYKDYGVVGFPAGNTGTQMAGWYRKEIKTVADLKGLKMRTMENKVHMEGYKTFGIRPTPMPFLELFTALQQGTVDVAANWCCAAG